jgi:hypothetical protein
MADEKDIIYKVQIDTTQSTADLKKLTDQLNNTKKATDGLEESVKNFEEVSSVQQESIEKTSTLLDANAAAFDKQKESVGTAAGALDKMAPGLGSVVTGIQGMTKSALAFIATPIGAVIGAIGIALAALIAYFKSSEEGQNRLNKITAIFSAVVEQLTNFLEDLGEAIYDAFTNPKQAMIDLYEFVKQNLINRFTAFKVILEAIIELDFKKLADGVIQVGTGVENSLEKIEAFSKRVEEAVEKGIESGKKMSDLQAAIDVSERKLIVARAAEEAKTAQLRDQILSAEKSQRKDLITEAIKGIQQLSDAELGQAQRKLALAREERDNNGADKEALLKVAEAEADVLKATASRFENAFKFRKQFEALDAAEDAAALARQKELDAELEKDHQDFLARMKKLDEDDRAAKAKADAEEKKKKEATAAAEIKLRNLVTNNELALLGKATKEKTALRVIGNAILKKDAILETKTNAFKGATAAQASAASVPVIGWLLGPIAYAAVLAAGLYSVSQILGIGFAGGGRTGMRRLSGTRITKDMGIPINRSNGDNLLATVAIDEAIINKQQQARLGGAPALRAAGVPGFFGGGNTGVSESRLALGGNRSSDMDNIYNAIANIKPIAFIQDFEAASDRKNEPANRAIFQ